MPISKDWSAIVIKGIAGNEIIVKGKANTGKLDVIPSLEKRVPQGFNPTILQLDLLHAIDAIPENLKDVQYNEKIAEIDTYTLVEIFSEDQIIESIEVTIE
ncbi:hypothetical protein SIO70_23040 [Chitinophaga sancti]|uniref:hypothetical protein n=1 Tax=Chitinophaga sancti TaxID=1004 RepID=UPI002A74DCD2|nr:hypothetical protein [Chitinophaga sancti]WPQ61239.1 hypothetical protein SIO70_23040 [Chitinophaga sancti]